jgi:hypothetical protein
MKRITANITSLMVVVLLLTAASYAQQHLILKVDVPFEFSVGKKAFPAGEYVVVQVAPHTLALRDRNDKFLTAVMTASAVSLRIRPASKLKFELKDGRYALSEVWAEGSTSGYRLSLPKQQDTLAQNHSAGTEVQASTLSSTGK